MSRDRASQASVPFSVETPGPGQQRVSFRVGDSWCNLDRFEFSGLRLDVGACQFTPGFAFAALQPACELELGVSRGGVIATRTPDGHELCRGGNALQLGRSEQASPLAVRGLSEARTDSVFVSLSRARLCELLGVERLPAAFLAVSDSTRTQTLVSHAMNDPLYRLLEEIAEAKVSVPSRLLYYQAKSLELIALISDELAEADGAEASRLSTHDLDRLERVRICLLERAEDPPTLAELARQAGFSATKLKLAFRQVFGTSLFSYSRRARLERARTMLLEQHLSVSYVARSVGYANPSKFAAAFRRQFGMSPSEL